MDTSFERKESKEDWITPPELVKQFGHFDLDPCASHFQAEFYADENIFIEQNGLSLSWEGKRVWCNPPYGTKAKLFIERCARHNNSIVLIFARPDTQVWHKEIFPKASAILFMEGRIRFYDTEGVQSDCAGAASALIAYGAKNAEVMEIINQQNRLGYFIRLR